MANPYIGYISDGVVLVGGGNGFGANGSDEIGRIGARLATRNEWTRNRFDETPFRTESFGANFRYIHMYYIYKFLFVWHPVIM
jgi:glycine/D-amino acid oxidase-like deaminating enzyme